MRNLHALEAIRRKHGYRWGTVFCIAVVVLHREHIGVYTHAYMQSVNFRSN